MNLFGFPRTFFPVLINTAVPRFIFPFLPPTPFRMTTAMDPPPPPPPPSSNPTTSDADSQNRTSDEPSSSEFKRSTMGPPPPKHSMLPKPEDETGPSPDIESEHLQPKLPEDEAGPSPDIESEHLQPKLPEKDASETAGANSTEYSMSTSEGMENSLNDIQRKKEQRPDNISVPYTIPKWSAPPCHQYFLEVLKDGSIIDQLDVNKKGAYMFGRVDMCDFLLEHPTISRFHAVIQFKSSGVAFIYDLGSTHGTFINKNQVKKKVFVELHVGDVIRFGHSSRLYIFQGPPDLMPQEADLKIIRKAKIQQEMQDMEASLQRAKLDATMADGISWGMQEDAIEENEDEVEEITWQTYKGQLTEKQEKTREKVLKRLEKVAHMKKEINAIRAKDIAQGGLTQGQQTQIARNEQRIAQIMEELENLEETLNDSIRESIGARAGRTSHGKKKGFLEDDEDDYLSDDDEFYDRTQKHPKQKSGENQSIETADSLLDKKEAILEEIEEKRKLISDEDRTVQQDEVPEAGDVLEAFMSTVSSQIATDKKDRLQKVLGSLQSELDRVLYLLKIADPAGEMAKRRESKGKEPTRNATAASDALEASSSSPQQRVKGPRKQEMSLNKTSDKQCMVDNETKSSQNLGESETVANTADKKTTVYTVAKPQWLGAVEDKKNQDEQVNRQEGCLDIEESDEFVDYKDRKKILEKSDDAQLDDLPEIENAAPGLIIRKRKHMEKPKTGDAKSSERSKEAEREVEGVVSLLLKHSRGYVASDEEPRHVNEDVGCEGQGKKDKKRPKRVLGPEKPTFLSGETEYEPWVPPQGQSGDGRTSLNDRYGY